MDEILGPPPFTASMYERAEFQGAELVLRAVLPDVTNLRVLAQLRRDLDPVSGRWAGLEGALAARRDLLRLDVLRRSAEVAGVPIWADSLVPNDPSGLLNSPE